MWDAQEPECPRSDGHVRPARKTEGVADRRRPAAFGVGHGGNANQFDIRTAKQQGECAEVIGIAADIGVEVNAQHRWSLQTRRASA